MAEKSAKEGLSHDPAHRYPKMNQLLGSVLARRRTIPGRPRTSGTISGMRLTLPTPTRFGNSSRSGNRQLARRRRKVLEPQVDKAAPASAAAVKDLALYSQYRSLSKYLVRSCLLRVKTVTGHHGESRPGAMASKRGGSPSVAGRNPAPLLSGHCRLHSGWSVGALFRSGRAAGEGAARRIFGLRGGDSPHRRLDAILPSWVLDRVEEVLSTGIAQTAWLSRARAQRKLRIGILAMRNWDDDGGREALLRVEDLSVGWRLSPTRNQYREPRRQRLASSRPS